MLHQVVMEKGESPGPGVQWQINKGQLVLSATARTRRETGMMPRGRKPKHPSKTTKTWNLVGCPAVDPCPQKAAAAHGPGGQGLPVVWSMVAFLGVQCVSKQKAHANRRARESFSQTQTVLRVSQARHMIGKRSRVQPTVIRHKSKRGAWHRLDDDKLRAEG